ncbi:MAG TPA: hypothetical protein VFN03_00075 [Trueperaceae bacterium]|nr:hypothetical protein [Trueperaceae bacterium]
MRTVVLCVLGGKMATERGVEAKQNDLIRRLIDVADEVVLDELGRLLDEKTGTGSLRRLQDDEMEAVLRDLLDGHDGAVGTARS